MLLALGMGAGWFNVWSRNFTFIAINLWTFECLGGQTRFINILDQSYFLKIKIPNIPRSPSYYIHTPIGLRYIWMLSLRLCLALRELLNSFFSSFFNLTADKSREEKRNCENRQFIIIIIWNLSFPCIFALIQRWNFFVFSLMSNVSYLRLSFYFISLFLFSNIPSIML